MNAPDKLPASAEPHVMTTYGRLPLALSHGRGCWVWDTEGKKYLDGLGWMAGWLMQSLMTFNPATAPMQAMALWLALSICNLACS